LWFERNWEKVHGDMTQNPTLRKTQHYAIEFVNKKSTQFIPKPFSIMN